MLEPWPRTATFLHAGAGRPPLRVVLEDVAVAAESAADSADGLGGVAAPATGSILSAPASGSILSGPALGSILSAEDAGLVVACGENSRLVVRRLVPEGRRGMSAGEFLRGNALFADARFG